MDYRTRKELAALALVRAALSPMPMISFNEVALDVLQDAIHELAMLRQQAVEPVHVLN
jgi:hypothetical protein